MKQNSPVNASTQLVAFLMVALVLFSSACYTMPRRALSEPHSSLEAPHPENSVRININTASAQELEKLPGVGTVIAERIVAHRGQYGPFRLPEHLMMVRGVSDRKFREIRSMIVVE